LVAVRTLSPLLGGTGRDFRLLAGGQGLSWLGNTFQPVALAVAIVVAGGTAGELGTVMAVAVVGRLVCTLFGGVWADRVAPQRIMVMSDVVRALAVSGVALMFGTGHRSLLLLSLLVAVMSGAGAFFFPAMSSLKPMLVPAERRQAANATLSLLQTGSTVVGPAMAGLLVAFAGAPIGFGVNAVTYLVSAVTVALIRVDAPRAQRTGMLHELRAGWVEIRRHDWLFWGVVAAGVYHVANGVILVLVQVVAVRDLGGATAVGFISTAEGVGGVIGGLVAMRFRPRRLLLAGFSALGLMPVWAAAYVWPGALTGVMAGAVVGFAGLTFFGVCWETALQDHVPHHLLARVASWDILTSFVGMPLGNALAGPLADRLGVHPVLLGCAVVLLVAGLSPLVVPGTRALRAQAASRPVEPPVPA
jgi:MFS family permease